MHNEDFAFTFTLITHYTLLLVLEIKLFTQMLYDWCD